MKGRSPRDLPKHIYTIVVHRDIPRIAARMICEDFKLLVLLNAAALGPCKILPTKS